MNVLFIFGNGFDRNLGLKTSYQDFYKIYLSESSQNEAIAMFKTLLQSDKYKETELWSDLELLMGACSSEYDDVDDFRSVVLDINESLRRYIEKENHKVKYREDFHNEFINDILNFPDYLSPKSINLCKSFANTYGTS